jgi:eukaryotic-like serine/threonine-protein kinase
VTDRDRVKAVFFEASELHGEERAAFLEDACGGDIELRAEVQSLLAHHSEQDLRAEPTVASPSSHADSATTAALGGRYRQLGELGQGAFGRVVRCFDSSLRREVALKEALEDDEDLEALLLQEARLLAYLDHPGVVQVYDVQGRDGSVAYTMKVLNGSTLRQRLIDQRYEGAALAVSEVVRIVGRICEAMANAHDKGVLHLDLKPANVMLEPFGQVSVIDWGVSRFFDSERYRAFLVARGEEPAEELGDASTIAGTPAYMPPEQFSQETQLSPAADVYAVGTMLFELLTDSRPFPRTPNLMVLASLKATAAPPSLRELRLDVPERLDALCRRMLAPRVEDRVSSFKEVIAELASLGSFDEAVGRRAVRADEILFEQGEGGTTAFQILEGEFEISTGGPEGPRTVVALRGAGDIIGELAMLSRSARTARVTAVTDGVVRALDWPALEQELAKLNPLIGQIMRSLSDKLVETTRG